MKVTTLIQFDDVVEGLRRFVGDEFEVTEERFEQINKTGCLKINKPLVAKIEDTEIIEDEGIQYSKMSFKELKNACEERNIKIPARAKKADLVTLLESSD